MVLSSCFFHTEKVIGLVSAIAKLQNFCINQTDDESLQY